MFYKFPHITHIQQVLDAIAGRDEFVVKVDEANDYTVVNYLVNFEDTFPEVTDLRTAILRECRGITFRTSTGEVISRKYHKFFNIGERRETLPENIDWNAPHRRFKKLDGSMITPLLVSGEVRWCTKMGLTGVAAPVDDWTADKPHITNFAKEWMHLGYTPIFEWCSRIQRIVIDYAVTDLVLTAIRHNITGEYVDALLLRQTAEANGITCAPFGEVLVGFNQTAMDEIRAVEGEEGDVYRWENGHMGKLKGEWYCQLHKTLDHLNHEKDVIRLILDEKLDDAKPFLPEDLVKRSDDFAKSIYQGLRERAGALYWEVQADFDNMNGGKKRFAEKLAGSDRPDKRFAFWAWDHLDEGEEGLYGYLVKAVGDNLGSQTKVNNIRWTWSGTSWSDYRDAPAEE